MTSRRSFRANYTAAASVDFMMFGCHHAFMNQAPKYTRQTSVSEFQTSHLDTIGPRSASRRCQVAHATLPSEHVVLWLFGLFFCRPDSGIRCRAICVIPRLVLTVLKAS